MMWLKRRRERQREADEIVAAVKARVARQEIRVDVNETPGVDATMPTPAVIAEPSPMPPYVVS